MADEKDEYAPTWLDSVLAAGTVGLLLETQVRPWSEVLDLGRVSDAWRKQGRVLAVSAHDVFTIAFEDGQGFSYKVEPQNASVSFAFSVVVDGLTPGSQATAEVQNDGLRRFSKLFPRLLDEAKWLQTIISSKTERKLIRVGFVANASMPKGPLPLGAQDILSSLGQVLGREPKACSAKLLVELDSAPAGAMDQCHHHLDYEANPAKGFKISLDWQRILAQPIGSGVPAASAALASAAGDAYKYFGRFGEGLP